MPNLPRNADLQPTLQFIAETLGQAAINDSELQAARSNCAWNRLTWYGLLCQLCTIAGVGMLHKLEGHTNPTSDQTLLPFEPLVLRWIYQLIGRLSVAHGDPITNLPFQFSSYDLWAALHTPNNMPPPVAAFLVATLAAWSNRWLISDPEWNDEHRDSAITPSPRKPDGTKPLPTDMWTPSVILSNPKPTQAEAERVAVRCSQLHTCMLLNLMVTKKGQRVNVRLATSIHAGGSTRTMHLGKAKERDPQSKPLAQVAVTDDQKVYWRYAIALDIMQSAWCATQNPAPDTSAVFAEWEPRLTKCQLPTTSTNGALQCVWEVARLLFPENAAIQDADPWSKEWTRRITAGIFGMAILMTRAQEPQPSAPPATQPDAFLFAQLHQSCRDIWLGARTCVRSPPPEAPKEKPKQPKHKPQVVYPYLCPLVVGSTKLL